MSRRSRNSRVVWPAVAAVLLAVPACALGNALGGGAHSLVTGARAAAEPAPRLGRASSPGRAGFGRVSPQRIFLGGGPTGLVEHIHWTGWGRSQAIGYGDAEYDWPGTAVAANGFTSGARVVAFHLGTCRGQPSYNRARVVLP
jgi:hypothetical protein